MKNVEKVIKDRIHKIESNNLDVLEYNTDSEILTRCKFCLYIKSDNYRNLSYKKFKCKSHIDQSEYNKIIIELDKHKYIKNIDLQLIIPSNPVLKNLEEVPNKLKCIECGTVFKSERSIYYHRKHVCPSKTTNNIILTGIAKEWCTLVSNGTAWYKLQGNNL